MKKLANTFQWVWVLTALLNLLVDFIYQPDFKTYPWNLVRYLFYIGIGFGICGFLISRKTKKN